VFPPKEGERSERALSLNIVMVVWGRVRNGYKNKRKKEE
jgi:hypothetical protein